MSLRIISGPAGGIPLKVPGGLVVRPTAARARQALFDSLGGALGGSAVLDLFAGSGALGLEAASRGAARVVFIEKNPRHCRIITENITKVGTAGLACEFRVIVGEVGAVFNRKEELGPFRYIFADPPYAQSGLFLERLAGSENFRRQAATATLIWELPPTGSQDGAAPTTLPLWEIEKCRKYGKVEFLFLKAK